MNLYGLIGFPLSHSASPKIFEGIFKKWGLINSEYRLFPLESIELLPDLIRQNPSLKGLNVTIPYKKQVIPYLSQTDGIAGKIGAVNVIKVSEKRGNTSLKGYNTDVSGFEISFNSFLGGKQGLKSLVLGSGGSSLVVQFVLQRMNIPFSVVSRNKKQGHLSYTELNKTLLEEHRIIVNTTPAGMFPNEEECPAIPFQFIGNKHYLFDLIYNPSETIFLKMGREQGAMVKNGMEMLQIQAEKAWEIWNKH